MITILHCFLHAFKIEHYMYDVQKNVEMIEINKLITVSAFSKMGNSVSVAVNMKCYVRVIFH